MNSWRNAVSNGSLLWKRWRETLTTYDIFNIANTPKPTDPRQGYIGDCYIMSSLSTIAEKPELVKSAILTSNKNTAGIYGIRFYIRGKPWVVSIDDNLLFNADNTLFFAL